MVCFRRWPHGRRPALERERARGSTCHRPAPPRRSRPRAAAFRHRRWDQSTALHHHGASCAGVESVSRAQRPAHPPFSARMRGASSPQSTTTFFSGPRMGRARTPAGPALPRDGKSISRQMQVGMKWGPGGALWGSAGPLNEGPGGPARALLLLVFVSLLFNHARRTPRPHTVPALMSARRVHL